MIRMVKIFSMFSERYSNENLFKQKDVKKGKEGAEDSSLLVCNSMFTTLHGIFPEDLIQKCYTI